MISVKYIDGSCLCGIIQFSIESPVDASAHCHCHYCRLSSGSAFVTWVVVADSKFKLVSGEDFLKWYESSEFSKRGFCGDCGSTVFFRSSLCLGEIHVTRANLKAAVDPLPQYNCFYDQGVDWVSIDTGNLKLLSSESEEIRHYKKISPPSTLGNGRA